MKLNKILFYIGVIICMITLPLSIYLTFGCEKCNIKSLETENYNISNEINKDLNVNVYRVEKSDTTTFIVNILLNIFAGSVVLAVTSFANYLNCRKERLDNIMNECLDYSKLFGDIKYFIPKSYDESSYQVAKSKNLNLTYNKFKTEVENINIAELNEIVKAYVEKSKYGIRRLNEIFKDIGFMFDFMREKQKDYYFNIYIFIKEKMDLLKKYSTKFEKIRDIKNDYEKCEEYVLELQNKIFACILLTEENEADILSNIEENYVMFSDFKSGKEYVRYNEVSNKLLILFDKVSSDL